MKKVSVLVGVLSFVFYIGGCGSQSDDAATDNSNTEVSPAYAAPPGVNAVAQQQPMGGAENMGRPGMGSGGKVPALMEVGMDEGYGQTPGAGAPGVDDFGADPTGRPEGYPGASGSEGGLAQQFPQEFYAEGDGDFDGRTAPAPKLEKVDTPQQAVFEFNRVLMSRISQKIRARRGSKTPARGEGGYPGDYGSGEPAGSPQQPSRSKPANIGRFPGRFPG